MYYYKDICSGEIVDELVTDNILEVENKIKNGDFTFSYYEVIPGIDITPQIQDRIELYKRNKKE